MGLDWKRWLRTAAGGSRVAEVSCRELLQAGEEYRIRELAFWCCVNLIANAMGRCEFRSFRRGKEERDYSYYLWNVSPNTNQNSTVFIHKMVARLYQDNEALIVKTKQPVGKNDWREAFVVADSWQEPVEYAGQQNEYRAVTSGQTSYKRPFLEEDVLHLTLNYVNITPVIKGIFESYSKLVSVAIQNYTFENGQHWKVHVSQIASGQEKWAEMFQGMIEAQIKPFLNSTSGILPEMDGWEYENIGKHSDSSRDASHIRSLVNDIFDFTANGFQIPTVLLRGQVEGTGDAYRRFLSNCIDPLADQLSEEINRKLYGFRAWNIRDYMQVDTSAIQHFDLFDNAANIEKLIGSGYSYNDVQRAAGGREIEEDWANEHFITKNFAEAQNAVKGET